MPQGAGFGGPGAGGRASGTGIGGGNNTSGGRTGPGGNQTKSGANRGGMGGTGAGGNSGVIGDAYGRLVRGIGLAGQPAPAPTSKYGNENSYIGGTYDKALAGTDASTAVGLLSALLGFTPAAPLGLGLGVLNKFGVFDNIGGQSVTSQRDQASGNVNGGGAGGIGGMGGGAGNSGGYGGLNPGMAARNGLLSVQAPAPSAPGASPTASPGGNYQGMLAQPAYQWNSRFGNGLLGQY